jgi:Domain of unknown function (DUF1906)
MGFSAGFDVETYPGIATMNWLKANSNLAWCGYYLAPAPNRSPSGWVGQYNDLQADWGVVPIYVGQQDPRTGGPGYVPSSVLTTAQGTSDGQEAADLAAADGFPLGSFVFLDWEYGGVGGAGANDYISAWVAGVVEDGRFLPGLYCSHVIASRLQTLVGAVAPMVRFWCWKVTSVATHPFGGNLADVPAADPVGCGFASATMWQCEQNAMISLPEGAPVRSLQVDFNTALSANPAAAEAIA